MNASRPLVIIGGGPAGMAAAIEAARAGLKATLLDDSSALGGHVFRQPPRQFHVGNAPELGHDFARGEKLRDEFSAAADRVEVLSNTSVLAVWPNNEILWATDERSGVLRAERMIIASGAYDRPMPFPGWTLPGVMSAGGIQTLLKTMRVRPGRRALIAGTGLLILAVARRLHEAGVEIAAILDAGDAPWVKGRFLEKWREWSVIKDAREHLECLKDAGVPILSNHTVFEAHGPGEVRAASFGAVHPTTWRPQKDRCQRVDVDLVA